MTAAISLQDQYAYFQGNLLNTSFVGTTAVVPGNGLIGIAIGSGAYGTNSFGGAWTPDVAGMVRVDQAWGLFQASVAAHLNHAGYYNMSNEISGHPDDKWGWAAQLSLSIKNLPTGPRDVINVQAAYASGASRYVFQSLAAQNYAMFGGTGIPGVYQSVGFAVTGDAVFGGTSSANGTTLQLIDTYGMRGAFFHNWNAQWASSIVGAWAATSYNGTAKGLICANIIPLLTVGSTCNPDFQIWQLGTGGYWTPVKGFTFSTQVVYTRVDQKYSGVLAAPAIPQSKPAALYELKDQGTFSFMARAQQRLGYVEGANLIVDRVQYQSGRLEEIAREVVATNPDVIASPGTPMTVRLKAATTTIPIVAMTGDPIRFGLISNLARPGGNITGVSVDAGVEVWAKRLELLSSAVPKLVNVVFVSSEGVWTNAGGQAVRDAAQKLGISLVRTPLSSPYGEAEYRSAFSSIQRDQVDGLITSDEGQVLLPQKSLLVQLIQQLRLPAIFPYRDFAEAGGLMSYSSDIKYVLIRQAAQIAEILRGANPGDIPYSQAERFELVVNLKTAKELGIEMPAGLVAGAAAVIE